MKKSFIFMALFAAALAGEAPDATVRMTSSSAFEPKTVTIKQGGAVVWENDSSAVHTVTDDPQLASSQQDAASPKGAQTFNSGSVQPGKQYSHTFKVPGTYKYFCVPHEDMGMVGTVIVTK